MKKHILMLGISILIAFSLCGCGVDTACERNVNTTDRKNSEITRKYANVYEYIDEETGVHYLIYSHKAGYAGMGGMTPRLNADGSLYVTEMKEE